MDVHLLFVQRVERHPGQYAPEVLAAVTDLGLSEVSLTEVAHERIEDWNNRFAEECGDFEDNFKNMGWVRVSLNQEPQYFRDFLAGVTKVTGAVEVVAPPKGNHVSYSGITVTHGRKGGTIVDDEIFD
jgi:hypothetical protein